MPITIYHNPRCSKSRKTLELLRDKGIEPRIVEYVKEPPDEATLRSIFERYPGKTGDLVRDNEKAYDEAGLHEESTVDELIAAIRKHPIILERPIVIVDEKVGIGRPPESVMELL